MRVNPWWRRPAAEEKHEPARPEAESVESEEQTEVAAATAPVSEPPDDSPPVLTEPDTSSATEEDAAPVESVGTAVSAALEAATEPAEPAQATTETTEAAEATTPAPAKRRRRRRRGGRRSRRSGRGGGPEGREQGEDGDVAEARRSGPSPAARSGRAGRAAALLDLGGLERSLEGGSELDTEGLLARLDGELGKLVLRRVYADASDERLDRNALHGAGVEVVDVPSGTEVRGCSAAVRIVVDALELCYTKRGVGTVVLGATSVQMLPLVAKLQQNGVTVIGLGGAGGEALVRAQCDRFIDLSG
ncbi:MAG: NYN domain-containing protein [Acidobacteriota bacterium]|nr:NYN domain-containing protein [Acidobacteriota bacterium]MDE3265922.1 NYN domain-containing protein [Acidobacteriota bacterium]